MTITSRDKYAENAYGNLASERGGEREREREWAWERWVCVQKARFSHSTSLRFPCKICINKILRALRQNEGGFDSERFFDKSTHTHTQARNI